jgi:hypothetical protein
VNRELRESLLPLIPSVQLKSRLANARDGDSRSWRGPSISTTIEDGLETPPLAPRSSPLPLPGELPTNRRNSRAPNDVPRCPDALTARNVIWPTSQGRK